MFAPVLLQAILWPFKAAVGRFALHAPETALLRTLRPTGAFMISMKLAFGAGFILSLPWILWFLGKFVLPGLTSLERGYIFPALVAGTMLFAAGVAFCYFLMLPTALGFFWSYGEKMGIANEWTIENYVSLVMQLLIAFGAVFELPVVLLFLVKVGMIGHRAMRRARRYVIVGVFIAAAALTPTPDMVSQILLAVPMILLYEFSVWIACWMKP